MKKWFFRCLRRLFAVPTGEPDTLSKYWRRAPNGILFVDSLQMIKDGRFDRQYAAARQLAEQYQCSKRTCPTTELPSPGTPLDNFHLG